MSSIEQVDGSNRRDVNCDKKKESLERGGLKAIKTRTVHSIPAPLLSNPRQSDGKERRERLLGNQNRQFASSFLTTKPPTPLTTSFDDSLLLHRQQMFNKSKPMSKLSKIHNQRLGMFKRTEIVTSIDENFTDASDILAASR